MALALLCLSWHGIPGTPGLLLCLGEQQLGCEAQGGHPLHPSYLSSATTGEKPRATPRNIQTHKRQSAQVPFTFSHRVCKMWIPGHWSK